PFHTRRSSDLVALQRRLAAADVPDREEVVPRLALDRVVVDGVVVLVDVDRLPAPLVRMHCRIGNDADDPPVVSHRRKALGAPDRFLVHAHTSSSYRYRRTDSSGARRSSSAPSRTDKMIAAGLMRLTKLRHVYRNEPISSAALLISARTGFSSRSSVARNEIELRSRAIRSVVSRS